MTSPEFVPMSVGQILDRTFRVYKQNFLRFIAIVAVVQVPITLIMLVLGALVGGLFAAGRGEDAKGVSAALAATSAILFFMTIFLSILANALCQGALTKSVSESYLGRDVSVGEAYRFAWPKMWTLLWAGILVGLAVMGGSFLCIVPGVIFALWMVLTTPTIMVENLKATTAMGRSKFLVSGNLGKAFVLGFVVIVIMMIVRLLCNWGGMLLTHLLAATNPAGAIAISQLLALVGQILVAPISAAAYILLYYDLRIRKEAFDLEMLANSMGSGGPSPGAAAQMP